MARTHCREFDVATERAYGYVTYGALFTIGVARHRSLKQPAAPLV